MGSLSSKNTDVKYLLCVIDVFTKYAWVKPLKDKKGKTVLNAFIEFYNKFMQEWLKNNNILMYSTHIESKSVIAERFMRTLKSKIYKKMTANNQKSYLGYLNKLVGEYNNTYNSSVPKKSVHADYFALSKEIETDPKSPTFTASDKVHRTT